MKSHYLFTLLFLAIFISSCSTENDTLAPSVTETDLVQTVEKTSKEAYAAFTAKFQPNQEFDTSHEGIYQGIFSSRDTEIKGKIYINMGNDENYSAHVLLNTGEEIVFQSNANSSSEEQTIEFFNERGAFKFSPSIENPVATNVKIDEKDAYIRAYKERSNARVSVSLGTFVDSQLPSYNGNWDIVAGPDVFVTPFANLPLINQIVVSIDGDDIASTYFSGDEWEFACLSMGDLWPPVYEPLLDLLFMPAQMATIGNKPTNLGVIYYDGSYWDGSGLVCDPQSPVTGGFWQRAGRNGTFLLD